MGFLNFISHGSMIIYNSLCNHFVKLLKSFLKILQEHLTIVSELLRANLYEFQKYNRESEAEPYFTMPMLHVHLLGLICIEDANEWVSNELKQV